MTFADLPTKSRPIGSVFFISLMRSVAVELITLPWRIYELSATKRLGLRFFALFIASTCLKVLLIRGDSSYSFSSKIGLR